MVSVVLSQGAEGTRASSRATLKNNPPREENPSRPVRKWVGRRPASTRGDRVRSARNVYHASTESKMSSRDA